MAVDGEGGETMTESRMELYDDSRPQVRALAPARKYDADAVMATVLLAGDLDRLEPKQRVDYYMAVCESIGFNPLTKPFDLLKLNGRTVLYATRNATDQLRSLAGVSVIGVNKQLEDGLFIVTVTVRDARGRTDEDMGVVDVAKLTGEARANAMMKALTKAKRRATLGICGLGMLEESEISSIPSAQIVPMDITTGEIGQAVAPPTAPPVAGDHQRALAKLHAAGGELEMDHDDIKRFVADLKGIPVADVPSMTTWSLPHIGWATKRLGERGAEWVAARTEVDPIDVEDDDIDIDPETGEIIPTVFPALHPSLLTDADEQPAPRRNPDDWTN